MNIKILYYTDKLIDKIDRNLTSIAIYEITYPYNSLDLFDEWYFKAKIYKVVILND